MKSDLEIAHAAPRVPIKKIATDIGLNDDEIETYGHFKAKVDLKVLKHLPPEPGGKYILVTAVTPTPFGEGKTLSTLGLSLGLNRIGKRAIATIRQPSMGKSGFLTLEYVPLFRAWISLPIP